MFIVSGVKENATGNFSSFGLSWTHNIYIESCKTSALGRDFFEYSFVAKTVVTMEKSIQTYYWVATISRVLKIIGLFCKRALSKRLHSAKETYNFKASTNRRLPILI